MIVEVDDSKFFKRKYNEVERVNVKWVFGGVEIEIGKCFFEVGEDRTK